LARKNYDEIAWQKIMHNFITLAHDCQVSEQALHDAQWISDLGEPFTSMLAQHVPGDGIQGNISVDTHDAPRTNPTEQMHMQKQLFLQKEFMFIPHTAKLIARKKV
jgi:hypothetical protein